MTTSDFLHLVHTDLNKIEGYAVKIKSRIDDGEPSVEDVLHRLLSLKMFVDSLFQGVDEHIRNPYLLTDEEQK